jgi:hypothetical protein
MWCGTGEFIVESERLLLMWLCYFIKKCDSSWNAIDYDTIKKATQGNFDEIFSQLRNEYLRLYQDCSTNLYYFIFEQCFSRFCFKLANCIFNSAEEDFRIKYSSHIANYLAIKSSPFTMLYIFSNHVINYFGKEDYAPTIMTCYVAITHIHDFPNLGGEDVPKEIKEQISIVLNLDPNMPKEEKKQKLKTLALDSKRDEVTDDLRPDEEDEDIAKKIKDQMSLVDEKADDSKIDSPSKYKRYSINAILIALFFVSTAASLAMFNNVFVFISRRILLPCLSSNLSLIIGISSSIAALTLLVIFWIRNYNSTENQKELPQQPSLEQLEDDLPESIQLSQEQHQNDQKLETQ